MTMFVRESAVQTDANRRLDPPSPGIGLPLAKESEFEWGLPVRRVGECDGIDR